jgi:transcriptional regulator with XRE-family HTH domain
LHVGAGSHRVQSMSESPEVIEARIDSLLAAQKKLLKDLIRMRTAHGLSQEDLAERMSVTQPTVAAFERYDANPTLATIRRYAVAVNARLDLQVKDDCVEHNVEQFSAVASSVSAIWVDANVRYPKWAPSVSAYEIHAADALV